MNDLDAARKRRADRSALFTALRKGLVGEALPERIAPELGEILERVVGLVRAVETFEKQVDKLRVERHAAAELAGRLGVESIDVPPGVDGHDLEILVAEFLRAQLLQRGIEMSTWSRVLGLVSPVRWKDPA